MRNDALHHCLHKVEKSACCCESVHSWETWHGWRAFECSYRWAFLDQRTPLRMVAKNERMVAYDIFHSRLSLMNSVTQVLRFLGTWSIHIFFFVQGLNDIFHWHIHPSCSKTSRSSTQPSQTVRLVEELASFWCNDFPKLYYLLAKLQNQRCDNYCLHWMRHQMVFLMTKVVGK